MNGETTISSKNNMDNFNLVYKDSNFTTKVPIDFIKNNIEKIISKESFQKYFTDSDMQKLSQFMPQTETNKLNLICKILDPSSKIGLVHPLTCFNLMLKENFFTLPYLKQLDRFKIEALEEFISIMEKKYDHLNQNKTSYKEILANSIIENDCEVTCGIISLPLPLPKIQDNTISSGYTTLSEEEREEVTETFYETEKIKTRYEGLEMESSLSDERFKNLKMSKNQLTIRPRTKEEIETFQKNELERYKNPHLPWIYNDIEGKATIVAPVLKKILTGNSNKPRDHVLLKSDRPSYVTILCLARDAASRLPDGVGTRSDICDLLKDSQYVIERLSDTHLNNIVSGALDRLHYEKDPCVKYDLQKKLWIYLHKSRSLDYLPWKEHLTKSENTSNNNNLTDSQKNLMSGENVTPTKKKKGENFLKHKRKHS